MSRNRATTWLLVLVGPVWAFGLYHSMEERRKQIRPRAAHAWHARYAKLEPHLRGVAAAGIVYDPTERRKGNMRLFRAQYVLAPIVIYLRAKPPEARPRRLPLIYDFKSRESLAKVLAETATEAEARGVALDIVQVTGRLALVTMKEE